MSTVVEPFHSLIVTATSLSNELSSESPSLVHASLGTGSRPYSDGVVPLLEYADMRLRDITFLLVGQTPSLISRRICTAQMLVAPLRIVRDNSGFSSPFSMMAVWPSDGNARRSPHVSEEDVALRVFVSVASDVSPTYGTPLTKTGLNAESSAPKQ